MTNIPILTDKDIVRRVNVNLLQYCLQKGHGFDGGWQSNINVSHKEEYPPILSAWIKLDKCSKTKTIQYKSFNMDH